MYAIELFFETEFESYIRRKWNDLSKTNITSTFLEIEDIRPHVTLAVYNRMDDIEKFKKDFMEYFDTREHKINLKFDIVGTFPTTGTVFLKPTITREFIEFHRLFHEAFSIYSENANRYYIPDEWDPHCTFGIGLNKKQINDAIGNILNDFQPMRSDVKEIGFVEIIHDGNRYVSSKTLFSI